MRVTVAQAQDARRLLNEYYAEVGILDRDTPQSVHKFLSSADSGFWIAYEECERYNENAKATVFLRKSLAAN